MKTKDQSEEQNITYMYTYALILPDRPLITTALTLLEIVHVHTPSHGVPKKQHLVLSNFGSDYV
jgi:hypothetical protein